MNVCNLWCRTNWESLFKYKHLAFENHFYKNTLEIPEGAHGLKMLMFFSGFRTTSWTALLQTCWALLSSSLESRLSGVISPSSIYIKWQFIQGDETHVYNFSGSFSLSLFLFNPFTHTKSCSEGNSWVCIWKCKYDSSSCVCGTCSRLLSLSSCDLTDEQSSTMCLRVSSSSATVWLSCWSAVGWRGRWPVRQGS